MFKFIRKKLLEGMVKDIIKNLPVYKKGALDYLNEHKNEIFEEIKNAIVKIVKKHFEAKKEV